MQATDKTERKPILPEEKRKLEKRDPSYSNKTIKLYEYNIERHYGPNRSNRSWLESGQKFNVLKLI